MLDKVTSFLLPLLLYTVPLLFWTITPSPFATPKILLIVLSALLLIAVQAIELVKTRNFATSTSRLHLPLLAFALAILANLIFVGTGRTEALVERGALYLSCLTLAYYATLSTPRLSKLLNLALTALGVTLAIHSLLQLTVLGSATWLPAFMQERGWTPTGSPLTTLVILLIATCCALASLKKAKSGRLQSLYSLSTVLMLVASVAYISLMLRGGELTPLLLPYSASWSVALDSLKSLQSFFLGTGLGNFSSLYTRVKPLLVNQTVFWNLNPSSLTSEPLHLLATTGLLGFSSFLLLIWQALKKPTNVALAASALALIFTPASQSLVLIFLLLLGSAYSKEVRLTHLQKPHELLLVLTPLLAFIVFVLYWTLRLTTAELAMGRALTAQKASDGQAVYQNTLRAARLVPSLENYRLAYSSVNLRLASTLSQKSALSDDDRKNIAQLLSQAVREARVATTLAPGDARAWTALGTVYRNLINVAGGSDQFALSAYSQAVQLDPGNPALRVDYGGLLYQLGQKSEDKAQKATFLARARDQFVLAVQLKPDYANAYYNLSHTLEAEGNLAGATGAMEQVLKYLNPSSPDYGTAKSRLESLQASAPRPSPTPSSAPSPAFSPTSTDLDLPSPLPSPLPGGPIELSPEK